MFWRITGAKKVAMEKLKTKFRQFGYKLKHDYLTPEAVVLFVAIILCLFWTYQSVVSMTRSWELTERITNARKELELISLEVEASELENEYYASDEYQELQARKLANKEISGENMVILPENSEAAKNKHSETTTEITTTTTEEKEYMNIEKWLMYLFPSS